MTGVVGMKKKRRWEMLDGGCYVEVPYRKEEIGQMKSKRMTKKMIKKSQMRRRSCRRERGR